MAAQPAFQIPRPPPTLRLVSAPPPAPAREPEWVERAWASTVREIRRFLATAVAFGLRPNASARAWAEGRLDAQNPAGFFLNVLAISGVWRALWERVLGVAVPTWMAVLEAAAPYLGVVVSASCTHLAFRLLGGKPRRLSSTWAISIYASGGIPTMFLTLAAVPFSLIASQFRTPADLAAHRVAYVLSQAFAYPVFFWLVSAYSGLFDVRRRRGFVIVFVATLLLIVLLAVEIMVVGGVAAFAWHRFHH